MNTVDSIINLIRRYGMACYNQASPEHFDAEVKDSLLLQIHATVQALVPERDEYQVAADKLAGELKDMQRHRG